ncbi:MAG: AsmA family protein [Gemmatimonadales bacterium]|nr:AsmA family protein [Gemmatimonadales bacterium]
MKKLRKILLVTVGIIAGLFLLLVIGFKFFFPVEKAKNFALAQASEIFGREVSIGRVDLSLAGGLGLRLIDVKVDNPAGFEGEPFLTTEDIDFKVAIIPLLKGEISAQRLILNRPVIHALKRVDGTDNFTFPGQSPTPAPSADSRTDGPEPVTASIDRIQIVDGLVVFLDENTGTGARLAGLDMQSSLESPASSLLRAVGTAQVDSLLVLGDATLPNLTPHLEFTIEYDQATTEIIIESMDLDLNSIVLSLTGVLSGRGDELTARCHLSAQRITSEQILALAPPEIITQLKDTRISGEIALACDLDFAPGRDDPLDYQGTLTLNDLVLEQKDIPANIAVLEAKTTFKPNHLEFTILEATAGGKPLTGAITVRDFMEPEVSGHLSGAVDLAMAEPFLEPQLKATLAGLAGFAVEFSASLPGPKTSSTASPLPSPPLGTILGLNNLQLSGQLTLSNVRFSAATLPEPVEKLESSLEFDLDRITVQNLEAMTPSSVFSLSGTLDNPFPYFLPPELRDNTAVATKPEVDFALKSRRLDIDRLFPTASPGAATVPTTAPGDSVILIEFPDLVGQGTVVIDTLIYSKVEFTAITARVEIMDRRIDCLDAQARVYTGRASGHTGIDLNDIQQPRYSGSFSAEQIEAHDFLDRFTEFGGLFYGKFNLAGEFSAAGLDPVDIQQSLTLDSLADMNNGKVVTSGSTYTALSALADKVGQTLQQEQGLKNLSTSIRAENGKVILEKLRTGLGSFGDLTLGGSYGLDGAMDFKGSLLLSSGQTRKLLESGGLIGKMAGLLGGQNPDRIALPLSVSGFLKHPKMKIDYSALTKEAKENLQEDLKEDLKEDLGKKLKGLFK